MAGNALLPDEPLSDSILVGTGLGSVVRVLVPRTQGLCVELKPRGWKPASGSTSTLFVQDKTGKRQLRLDYGYNAKTDTVDYHWNQKGVHHNFGITGHTTAGTGGPSFYRGAKYYRHAGGVLLIAGAVTDSYAIVVASNRLRKATQVTAGWIGAWAGCKFVGEGGAIVGSAVTPGPGTAVGAFAGCILCSISGYGVGAASTGAVYDWVGGTFFTPVPQVPAPG